MKIILRSRYSALPVESIGGKLVTGLRLCRDIRGNLYSVADVKTDEAGCNYSLSWAKLPAKSAIAGKVG